MDKRKVFLIIQARMTSTRLPGKIMLPIGNRCALEVMIARLEPLAKSCELIIATTDDGTEAPIVSLCDRLKLNYYRGDTNDVLRRYYETALKFGINNDDIIVRLTSDCPLIDPAITKKTIDYFKNNSYDYVSNVVVRTYPRGLDTQVTSFSNLKVCHERSTSSYERDHVTTYIDETHSHEFKIGSVEDGENNSKYRITLDEEKDYEAIVEIYKKFDYGTDFSYRELIGMLNANPYIYEINKRVEQKKN